MRDFKLSKAVYHMYMMNNSLTWYDVAEICIGCAARAKTQKAKDRLLDMAHFAREAYIAG